MANTGAERGIFGKVALWAALFVVVAIAAAIWLNQSAIAGIGHTGTSYAARIACSCRFIAGRSLEDCAKDKVAGMELVSLSDDAEAKSVTASLLLLESTTATYREGYGCVLEEWEG